MYFIYSFRVASLSWSGLSVSPDPGTLYRKQFSLTNPVRGSQITWRKATDIWGENRQERKLRIKPETLEL